jgi:hypothetical protein
VPRDYAITVPDTWVLIPLQPGFREKAIGTLIRRQFAGTTGAAGVRAASATDITFYFSVPGSGAWLLLAFSAPAGTLAAVTADLFDAIAATLRWAE